MSKKVKIELEYFEKGESKKIDIIISRIFNWALKEHGEIIEEATQVQIKYKNLQDKLDELSYESGNFEGSGKDLFAFRDKMQAEIKELTDGLNKYKDSDFFKRRFDLIVGILDDNGIDDERLKSFDFWDRQVDPEQLMIFLNKACYKDIAKNEVSGRAKTPSKK
jgi:hypothetical protein